MLKRLFWIAISVSALLATFVLLTRPDAPLTVIGDGPLYQTTTELENDSDLIIHGIVGEVDSHYIDSAGDPDTVPGLPKVVLRIDVAEALKGAVSAASVYVVTADTEGTIDTWNPYLEEGEEVVLYLFRIPDDAPNMSAELKEQVAKFGSLYGIVGGNQGVFDVNGDVAVSRSESNQLTVTGLTG